MFTETLPASRPRSEKTKPRPVTAFQCKRISEILASGLALRRHLGKSNCAVSDRQGKPVKFPQLVLDVASAMLEKGKNPGLARALLSKIFDRPTD